MSFSSVVYNSGKMLVLYSSTEANWYPETVEVNQIYSVQMPPMDAQKV